MRKFVAFFVFLALFTALTVFSGCAARPQIVFVTDAQSDDGFESVSVKSLTAETMPKDPTKESAKFEGWFFDLGTWQEALDPETFDAKKYEEDVKVYAKWTSVVKWVDASGTVLATETYVHGETPSYKGTKPERISDKEKVYTFIGWSDTLAPVDKNVTYTAQFKEQGAPYTITLDLNGGIFADPSVKQKDIAVRFGEEFTLPEPPTKTGCRFDGWFVKDLELTSGTYEKTKNVTAVAKWTSPVVVEDGYVTDLTEYGNTLTDLVIPSDVDGQTVIGIDAGAFMNCSQLASVIIPDTVTYIGNEAFRYCQGLTQIDIPDAVTYIGKGAFQNCTNLTSMTLPFVGCENGGASNTHFGYIFGAATYSNNQTYVPANLKTVVVQKATSIASFAFYGCSHLESVTLPADLTNIGTQAFYGCSALTMMTIPEKVINLGQKAFQSCTALVEISVPEKIENIGVMAFDGCPIETATIPGEYCSFVKNSALTTVTITGDAPIEANAFSGCELLENVTIEKNVSGINASAFENCTALKTLVIPDGVVIIETSALAGCTSLETLKLPFVGKTREGTNDTHFGYIFGADTDADNSAKVPASLKTVEVMSAVKIDAFAFLNCGNIEAITIQNADGNPVASFGKSAFEGCAALKTLSVPFIGNTCDGTSDTHFGFFFGAQTYLNNKDYVPSSLTTVCVTGAATIDAYAFQDCVNITNVTIDSGVVSIGTNAFFGCSGLENLTMKKGIGILRDDAFNNCEKLEKVTFAGKKADWCKIEKTDFWNGEKAITIQCENGVLNYHGSSI